MQNVQEVVANKTFGGTREQGLRVGPPATTSSRRLQSAILHGPSAVIGGT